MSTQPKTRDEATGPVVETTPEQGGTHHDHPGEAQYIMIAAILAAITGAEVAIYYIKALKSILVPALVAFSIIKFVMVVAFFMHLRFDSRLFRRLFIAGVALALFCFTIVLTTFHVWTR
ncbi:MAG: cytochrome C oxidase subunit IV family protein [Actinomycetota bacterium]|nr:cytochrome C oxidase subunit IV family protein [Actinomycetota bacterium]